MTVTCGRARRLLWPEGSPREATLEVIDAQMHLAGCHACAEFFGEMRTVAGLIHRAAVPEPAPPDVRDRLFQTVARARMGAPTRRRWPRWALAGAVALVTVSAGLWPTSTRAPASDPVAAFADDHVRAAAGPGVRTTEASTAASWLRERLPFAIQVPQFPDGRVEAVRLCLMAGMRGGVVEYRLGEHDLSYYVVPADANMPARAARELRSATRAGYRVVTWREGELVHALVADLPDATLRELARICIAQSTGVAAGGRGEFATHPVQTT